MKKASIGLLALALLLLSQIILFVTLNANSEGAQDEVSQPRTPTPTDPLQPERTNAPTTSPTASPTNSPTPSPTTPAPTPSPTPLPVIQQNLTTFSWKGSVGTQVECYQFSPQGQYKPFGPNSTSMSHSGVCVLHRACYWNRQIYIVYDDEEQKELGPTQVIPMEPQFDFYHWPPTLNTLENYRLRPIWSLNSTALFDRATWFPGNSWIVHNSYQQHTSHWFETTSQMFLARHHLGDAFGVTAASTVLLVTHEAKLYEWQVQTMVGGLMQSSLEPTILQPKELVNATEEHPFCFERVSVPGFLYHMFPYESDGVAYRQQIYRHLGMPASPPQNLFVVLERGMGVRLIRNQEELLANLSSYAQSHSLVPKVVDFGKMTFREQVDTCARAKVLLGMHGAGLQNLMFMQTGAAVVEMNSYRFFENRFYDLAAVTGVKYFAWTGTRIDDTDLDEQTKAMMRSHETFAWPVSGYGGLDPRAGRELDTVPPEVYIGRRNANVRVNLGELGSVLDDVFSSIGSDT